MKTIPMVPITHILERQAYPKKPSESEQDARQVDPANEYEATQRDNYDEYK